MKYIALILSLLNINLFFMISAEMIKLDKKFMRVTLENKKSIYILYQEKNPMFNVEKDEKLKEINEVLNKLKE